MAKKKSTKKAEEKVCEVCGKPLSRHKSVSQGMGETCHTKLEALRARGFEDAQQLRASTIAKEVPAGWILLKDAINKAKKKQTSTYRFLQLIGGDRMAFKPYHKDFKVVFFAGARYISPKALDHLPVSKELF